MPNRTLLLVAVVLFSATVYAQAPQERINGDVVALDGATLQVKPAAGNAVAVKLAPNARISLRSPANLAALEQGMYVGATATPQPDGTLLASEIQVFPEAMRGTGEGHRPMATPGDTMTNATVSTIAGAAPAARGTTTNATVATVGGAAGGKASRTLMLTYKGGEKQVVVPEGITIFRTDIVDRAALRPGAHVLVYAATQPDGTLLSERVSVGKDGYVPVR